MTDVNRLRRLLLVSAWAIGSASATNRALATSADQAAAEVLFRDGKQLMAEGAYERACPKLAESYRLDPATGALLATALCFERAGKLATAWATYTEAAGRAKQEGSPDREQSARSKAAELEGKLDHLVVHVAGGDIPGLVVTRDGTPVGQAEWGAPLPVDAGSHVIEATAPGKARFRAAVTVQGGASARVNVPALTDLPSEGAVGAPAAAAAQSPTDQPTEKAGSEFWTPLRITGTVAASVGVAAIGVGAVFGVRALSLNGDSNAGGHCDDDSNCDTEGTSLRNDARTAGTISTWAIAGGAVLAAGGIALFALGAPDSPTVSVWVAPPVAGGSGGIILRGRL